MPRNIAASRSIRVELRWLANLVGSLPQDAQGKDDDQSESRSQLRWYGENELERILLSLNSVARRLFDHRDRVSGDGLLVNQVVELRGKHGLDEMDAI